MASGRTTIRWGTIGTNEWDRLRGPSAGSGPDWHADDRLGVVRSDVDGGVEYALKPGADFPIPGWSRLADRDNVYEMDLAGFEATRRPVDRGDLDGAGRPDRAARVRPLGGYEPPRAESLEDLLGSLAMAEAEALDRLDGWAELLLEAARGLHDRQVGLGTLQPANAVRVEGRDGPILALPDVGFYWDRDLFVVMPDWLRRDVPFAWLWDATPEKMNEVSCDPAYRRRAGRPAELTAEQRQADLRTVARLLAWLMSGGQELREIPSREDAAWVGAPVWGVLDDVIRGRITSAVAFRDALRASRPSQHYIELRKSPRPVTKGRAPRRIGDGGSPARRVPWGWLSASGLVVAAIVVAVLLVRHPRPDPLPVCAECSGGVLAPRLIEYARVRDEARRLSEQVRRLREEAAARPDAPERSGLDAERAAHAEAVRRWHESILGLRSAPLDPEGSSLRAYEEACLEKLAGEYLEDLAARAARVMPEAYEGGVPYATTRQSMRAMMAEYDALSKPRSAGPGPSSPKEPPSWYADFAENLRH